MSNKLDDMRDFELYDEQTRLNIVHHAALAMNQFAAALLKLVIAVAIIAVVITGIFLV